MAKRAGGGETPQDPGPPRGLSARHRKTLASIFERPARGDIPWRDVEAMFVALGGTVTNGKGSIRRVKLHEVHAVFHEPHPERVTDKGAIKSLRDFLLTAGVRP